MQQKHETCPKTMKQWWHETYILPSELRAPNIQALWSLRHFFFFLFFAPCPLNNKTVVENKAYNISGGVLKLMTPKTGSVHTKNNDLWKSGWPSNTKDCHCFSKVPWQFWPDHIWGKKTSLPYLGEELMIETWHLLKKEKEGPSSPNTFLLIIKLLPSEFLGHSISRPPAC